MLRKYAVEHYLDTVLVSDKILILKELFDGRERELGNDESYIYQYLQRFIFRFNENKIGIIMANGNKNIVYIGLKKEDESFLWEEASPDDYMNLPDDFHIEPKNISNIVGFMAPFKSGEIIFKLKTMNTKRNKIGIKALYADVAVILNKINEIVGKTMYDKNPFPKKTGLCILLEILMREYLDKYRDTKPIEFLPPEFVIINNIQEL
jgi:hypothetical protein